MGMTFNQTYECTDCGYVFKGLSGMQDHGNEPYDFKFHDISPMICPKCKTMKNVVTGFDIDDRVTLCENCGIEMEHMEEDVIYECPQCHKKTLKCVNTESVYASGNTIYIY